jgi:phosphoglycerate dehydrogenase-like enzyme
MSTGLRVVIATPLEPELVEQIATSADGLSVRYEPTLLPPARYPADHRGRPDFRRTPEQQRAWQELLAAAEVSFGIPGDDPRQLGELVRTAGDLRLVQATAAGVGQQVQAARLSADDLRQVAVAGSSGVHAGPVAEFAMAGILAFARDLPRLDRDRVARRWEHYPTRDVAGRTILILGIGAIGSRVAELAHALGLHVIGVNSTGRRPDAPVDECAPVARLPELAARADVLVITLPATAATANLVDAAVLHALPADAIVVNVGRGSVVDEAALIDVLRTGRLAGAALDVTAEEPLNPHSPLWDLPNVILSPHTAALSPHENERIVALFLDNLDRLRAGEPIRNRITADTPY